MSMRSFGLCRGLSGSLLFVSHCFLCQDGLAHVADRGRCRLCLFDLFFNLALRAPHLEHPSWKKRAGRPSWHYQSMRVEKYPDSRFYCKISPEPGARPVCFVSIRINVLFEGVYCCDVTGYVESVSQRVSLGDDQGETNGFLQP